ncbi:hypothetical protein [Lactococcus ileimucosae]|uniref:hypothetical protein n=1 Tax=Lactococcus ileimucosae TaxID=2941329 RepID=UPI003510F5B1
MDIVKQSKQETGYFQLLLLPILFFASAPALISASLGWRPAKVVSVIRTAYSLWRRGHSLRTALSLATGGWGWAVSLLLQFGIAWLVSQAFTGSWIVGF